MTCLTSTTHLLCRNFLYERIFHCTSDHSTLYIRVLTHYKIYCKLLLYHDTSCENHINSHFFTNTTIPHPTCTNTYNETTRPSNPNALTRKSKPTIIRLIVIKHIAKRYIVYINLSRHYVATCQQRGGG